MKFLTNCELVSFSEKARLRDFSQSVSTLIVLPSYFEIL